MTERLHFHFSFSCIEEGNGNPLQCSCLENPRDRGAWWAAVYGVVQSWTQLKRLSSSSSSSIVFRVRYWNIQLWMLISPFLFFLQVRQLLLAVFWGSLFRYIYKFYSDFPGDSDGKESTCSMGDLGSIPGLERSPGEEKGYPPQYSGLEKSMDCVVAKSWTWLSDFHFTYYWLKW